MICENMYIKTRKEDTERLFYDDMISIFNAENDLCGFLQTKDGSKLLWKNFLNSTDIIFDTWDDFIDEYLFSQLGTFTMGVGFVSNARIASNQIKMLYSRKKDFMSIFFNPKSLKCVYASVDNEDDTQFVYIMYIKIENDCIVDLFNDPSTSQKNVSVTRKRKLMA